MIDEGFAGIHRLWARALRHARSRDLTRARTPNHVPHLSREPATRIIRVVLSRPTPSSRRTLDSVHGCGSSTPTLNTPSRPQKDPSQIESSEILVPHTGVLGHHVVLRRILRAVP